MKKVIFPFLKNKAPHVADPETHENQPVQSAGVESSQREISPSPINIIEIFHSDKFLSHAARLIGIFSFVALTFAAYEILVNNNAVFYDSQFIFLFLFFYLTIITIFFLVKGKFDKLSTILVVFLTTFGYHLLFSLLENNFRDYIEPMYYHLPFYFITICGIAFVGKDHISFEVWKKYTNYISNLFLTAVFCFIIFDILLILLTEQLYNSNLNHHKISDVIDNLWKIMFIVIPFFSFYITKTNPKFHNHIKNFFIHGLIIFLLGYLINLFKYNLYHTFFMRDRSYIIFLDLTFVIMLIVISLMGDIENHKLFTWILKLIYILVVLAIDVTTIVAMIEKMISQITTSRLIGFFDALFYFILLMGILILIIGFLFKKVEPIAIQKWILLPIPYVMIWITIMDTIFKLYFNNHHDLLDMFPFL